MNGQTTGRRSLEINFIEQEVKGKETGYFKYGAPLSMQLQEATLFACTPETTCVTPRSAIVSASLPTTRKFSIHISVHP
jgi:hypothetical protein